MTKGCRIAVALPPPLEERLHAAGYGPQLVPVQRPAGSRAADLVVLDPQLGVAPGGDEALAAHVAGLRAPCVFYTTSVPRALQAVVALQHLEPLHTLVGGVDDSLEAIRSAIADAVFRGDLGRLRHSMTGALGALPPTLQFALDLALRRPEQFFDAADVARHAGFSRRHVDRVLHHHGLAPAKQWVIAARVWHAHLLQRQRRMTSADAAARLGYADPKALRRHRESVLGHDGTGPAAGSDPDAALTRVRRYLTSSHDPGTLAAS